MQVLCVVHHDWKSTSIYAGTTFVYTFFPKTRSRKTRQSTLHYDFTSCTLHHIKAFSNTIMWHSSNIPIVLWYILLWWCDHRAIIWWCSVVCDAFTLPSSIVSIFTLKKCFSNACVLSWVSNSILWAQPHSLWCLDFITKEGLWEPLFNLRIACVQMRINTRDP